MNEVQSFNVILSSVKYPIEVIFFQDKFGVSIQSLGSRMVKIYLPNSIYIVSGSVGALVSTIEELDKLKINTCQKITSIVISEISTLEINFESCKLISFPGIYYGWGIYKNDKQIIQHYGWEEGIELGHDSDVARFISNT